MANTIKSATKRKRNCKPRTFFAASAKVSGRYVTIQLPSTAAEYLDLQNGKKVYWSAVNGVVQLSANVPNIVIPVLNVATSGFLPQ